MTYTLTTNELKVAECGSVDFSKFTDSTKGYDNVDKTGNGVGYGITFIAQDILDKGFTAAQGKTIIDSLVTKGVITTKIPYDTIDAVLKETNWDSPYLTNCLSKNAAIDGQWLFLLSEDFINDRAAS